MDTIEAHITKVFHEIREVIPAADHFSVEITYYSHSGKIKTHGYLHPNEKECIMYDSIDKIVDLLAERKAHRDKNEILYRKFS